MGLAAYFRRRASPDLLPLSPHLALRGHMPRPLNRRAKSTWVITLVISILIASWILVNSVLRFSSPPVSEMIEEQVALEDNTASGRWAPIILDKPLNNMPSHFAPLIAASMETSQQVYGEELLYPDFAIPIPIFAKDEHKRRWLSETKAISERATVVGGDYFQYKGQHGQNFASR
jgi:hypothetical protein